MIDGWMTSDRWPRRVSGDRDGSTPAWGKYFLFYFKRLIISVLCLGELYKARFFIVALILTWITYSLCTKMIQVIKHSIIASQVNI